MNMKKIGWGWQVSTYEYSNTVVYKKLHPFGGRLLAILRTSPQMIFMPRRLILWARHLKDRQLDSLRYITSRTELWRYIGRPVIELEGNYYQDKAIPLKNYFKSIPEEGMNKVIDDFVYLGYKFFQEGFIDKSFNFLKNFGFYNGKIILMDIGELFHDQNEVREQIKKRPWTKHYVLRIIPRKQRRYFIEKMDERFLSRKN